jgi:hypothetical protein
MRHLAYALATLLALTAAGRAEPLDFTYQLRIDAGNLAAYGPGPIHLSLPVADDGTGFMVDYGTGSIAFTVGGPFTQSVPDPGWAILSSLGNLTFTPTPAGPAGTFSFYASLYGSLTITDNGSGEVGLLPLTLYLNGTVGPDGEAFTYATASYAEVVLGGRAYGVNPEDDAVLDTTLNPLEVGTFIYAYPIQDTGGWDSIGGDGTVSDTLSPQEAPEPSSLALLGLGGLGLLGWRHRRRPS